MDKNNFRIALINPRSENYAGTMPPLGLLYIAAVLEQNGFSVKIFDLAPGDDSQIPPLIAYAPNVVGMTVLTDYAARAKQVAQIVVEKLPQAVFIVGGVHVTALPRESLHEFRAHFGVVGEGETCMLEICNRLLIGASLSDVSGVVWRKGEELVINPPGPFIQDLDTLPFPARHLLRFDKYLVPPGIIRGRWTERSTTVMSSRGCPFSCIWCGSQTTFGRKVRYRSVANVVSEIESLIDNYCIDAVWFVDDTFTLHRERVMNFCDMLVRKKIRLTWGCQAHVTTADEAMFRKMKQSGLAQLDFGVESGSDTVLKNLKKKSTEAETIRAFDLARKCGIRTCATFIFGSPGETMADVEKTFALARRIKPNFTSSFFLTPYPATELWDQIQAHGWRMNIDRSGKGLKKKPMLLIHFTEQELLSIRAKFQKLCAFRNFASVLLNPFFMGKAFLILIQYPHALLAGIRAFLRSWVFDDFLFAVLDDYVKQRVSKK